jgi:hypothetical protein
MEPIHIKLTYESLIAILQGKEFHLQTPDEHIIFHPPFEGVFLTHDQLANIKHQSQIDVFNIIERFQKYKVKRR